MLLFFGGFLSVLCWVFFVCFFLGGGVVFLLIKIGFVFRKNCVPLQVLFQKCGLWCNSLRKKSHIPQYLFHSLLFQIQLDIKKVIYIYTIVCLTDLHTFTTCKRSLKTPISSHYSIYDSVEVCVIPKIALIN